jgi:hypothetical protein
VLRIGGDLEKGEGRGSFGGRIRVSWKFHFNKGGCREILHIGLFLTPVCHISHAGDRKT